MPDGLDFVVPGIVIGVAASALMDVWSAALRRSGVPTLDYRLLGRWIGHMPMGRSPRVAAQTASDQIWAATTINRTTRPLVTPATMNPMIPISHSSMGQT